MIRVAPRVAAYGRAVYACLWLCALATVWAMVVAMSAGCGAAGRISAATACSGLLVAIGEARHLEPERALADIENVNAACRRLDVTDAGAP